VVQQDVFLNAGLKVRLKWLKLIENKRKKDSNV
jgi:hypothetical protein